MVLDPIPQPLPVHFFGSRPQPPTSPQELDIRVGGHISSPRLSRCTSYTCMIYTGLFLQTYLSFAGLVTELFMYIYTHTYVYTYTYQELHNRLHRTIRRLRWLLFGRARLCDLRRHQLCHDDQDWQHTVHCNMQTHMNASRQYISLGAWSQTTTAVPRRRKLGEHSRLKICKDTHACIIWAHCN